MEMDRVDYKWGHRWSRTYQQTIFYNKYEPKTPPPYNLTFFKGELHGFFTRKMVEYIVEDEVGIVTTAIKILYALAYLVAVEVCYFSYFSNIALKFCQPLKFAFLQNYSQANVSGFTVLNLLQNINAVI